MDTNKEFDTLKNINMRRMISRKEFSIQGEWEMYQGDMETLFDDIGRYENVEICIYNKNDDEVDIIHTRDRHSIRIELKDETRWEWELFINKSKNIKRLAVMNSENITEKIFELKNLVNLELIDCVLGKFDFCMIDNLQKLKVLIMDRTKLKEFPEKICYLKRLERLSMMDTDIEHLSPNINILSNLNFLGLNGTKISEIPDEIGELTKLKGLYLGQTKVKRIPKSLKTLIHLEHLALWETNLEELPEWIDSFSELRGLYLGRDENLTILPNSIGNLTKLEYLYLDGSGLKELPKSFGELSELKELQLQNTSVHKFPEIKKMQKLEVVNLSNMVLERIPLEFVNSGMKIHLDDEYLREGLVLENIKLLCQPVSLFAHEKEFINSYYMEKKVHLNETKIVFLGDGEAGKSHIIERIKVDSQPLDRFKQESTPGIAISQKHCVIGEENICLQIWDFGGQEIMHSMHRFFLTDRTLYIIVINARDNTQDERAKYWLNNVKNFACGCPVIIVLNKMDQNPTASINERLLMRDYPQIIKTLKMSALNDTKEEFSHLLSTIVSVVKTFDSYAMDFPISWNKIKTTLTEMKANYITDLSYREICKNNLVEDEQIQNWLLEWFHDLGVSFNYRKRDQLLGGYMVLKPTWLTNAIYIILFNGGEYSKNGIIGINNIVELLKNPPKSVEDIQYNITEVPYILGVMRRFEISYAIDDKNEFIPMMCDRNQHEEAERFIGGKCLEYYMEYEYLPNNVLHKLMIKMQDNLDKNKIWLTGMILQSRDGNISSLVRMHNNRIEIYVNSKDNAIYPKKEYLSQIRENLLNINRDLNLKADDTIVYKENEISEDIKYKTLLIYLSSNQKEYFSTVFRKSIPIKRILGMIESDFDAELIIKYCQEHEEVTYQLISKMLTEKRSYILYEELEKDLVECCLKLQGNSLQILSGKENDRNTYMRDLLSVNKKYILCDQTLNGLSSEKKSAGELDLLIKNNAHQPIAVLEALTLKSVYKEYIAKHIDKIFLYDTWGLENNYILCYVETANFKEFCKRYQKYISEYEYGYLLLDIEVQNEYAEIVIFNVVLLRNDKEIKITNILVNLQGEK